MKPIQIYFIYIEFHMNGIYVTFKLKNIETGFNFSYMNWYSTNAPLPQDLSFHI